MLYRAFQTGIKLWQLWPCDLLVPSTLQHCGHDTWFADVDGMWTKKGLPGYAAIYCSIYLFYDIYCIFNKYLPYHLEVEAAQSIKTEYGFLGWRGRGGS